MNTAAEISFKTYRGTAAENYERYFVPSIGAPVANDLLDSAVLKPGERVLDVACGTGLIARLASERVGSGGSVAAVDINPDMLGVARSILAGTPIKWYEAGAEKLPFPDAGFDAALCQLGLQFFRERGTALGEIYRVLVPGGRIVVSVPGPEPNLFAAMEEKVGRYLGSEAAGFVRVVFSLHDAPEIRDLLRGAGFANVEISATVKRLQLPPPAEFLWQYVHSTPLAAAASAVEEGARVEFEREVVKAWEPFTDDDNLTLDVRMTVAQGTRP